MKPLSLSLSAAALFSSLAGCVGYDAPSQTSPPVVGTSNSGQPLFTSPPNAKYSYDGVFAQQPTNRRLYSSPQEIADSYRDRFGSDPETELIIDHGRDGRSAMIYITATGFRDDSVRSEQWRILATGSGRSWGASRAEKRQQCWRGANAGQWTVDLCP